MKRIATLGAGEIGGTIKKIAEDAGYEVLVRELKYDELDGQPVEALHVCIPYKDLNFIKIVEKAVTDSKPNLLIIHTTTPPGITNKIGKVVKIPTAHSPVRGNHPDLYLSIKKNFVKYVGGVDKKSTQLAIAHLKKLGIKKVADGKSAINTEMGKMINIIAYAWSIVFCKGMKETCDVLGVDFEIAYTEFMKTYNEGYKKDKPHVVQPILKSIKGPIGGHCVVPDAVLLEQVYKNRFTQFILKEDESYKKEV
jgi:UDP-N-acetyl-D-mannosaminuronate dehydrogenase